MIGLSSYAMTQIPNLSSFLGNEPARLVTPWNLRHMRAIAGWGLKPSGARARRLAASRGVPALILEDGFIRSTERNGSPLSLILDEVGIYYDASAPSGLDHFLQMPIDAASRHRSTALIEILRATGVSKFNAARAYDGDLPDQYVLVADQVLGDLSVAGGLASMQDFSLMLKNALAENPSATILVKPHPDVLAGRATGFLQSRQADLNPRIQFLDRDASPSSLIRNAHAVYTVTSQLGFDALIHGCTPHVYGMPFYAGRGLTHDRKTPPLWRKTIDFEQLIHAALLQYCRYVAPETGLPAQAETVIEHLALQRRMRARLPDKATALHIPHWKRGYVRRFLPGVSIRFVKNTASLPAGDPLILWGNRAKPAGLTQTPVLRLEDGFIRSAGLGVDLAPPLSWCCDDLGIHYEPAYPSRLECILAQTCFEPALLQRAARLRQSLCTAHITKYNLKGQQWRRPQHAGRILLVAGQVESDASLERQGMTCSDAALLALVRHENPDAWIVYKPHPDTVSGIRHNCGPQPNASDYDEILPHADIANLLESVDEVHVMTSLTGFEALIRGRRVICHGRPFYAGWGLTVDRVPIPRRRRRLSLDELIAAALILYPFYINRRSREFTEVERVVHELLSNRQPSDRQRLPWRIGMRPLLRFANTIRQRQSARQIAKNLSPLSNELGEP